MLTKNEVREMVKGKRESFTEDKKWTASGGVIYNIMEEFEFEKTIMAYKSIQNEIDLDLLEYPHICYPKIEREQIVPRVGGFKKGQYDIWEPMGHVVDKKDISICFVPGLAFSREMGRIGYGKGYYDAFLRDFQGIKVGICYEEFMFDDFEQMRLDPKMDMIITDKKVYKK